MHTHLHLCLCLHPYYHPQLHLLILVVGSCTLPPPVIGLLQVLTCPEIPNQAPWHQYCVYCGISHLVGLRLG